MTTVLFTGEVKRLNDDSISPPSIGEALAIAIAKAKEELGTTLVHWKLNEITGVHGGFTQENTVNVTIEASSGP